MDIEWKHNKAHSSCYDLYVDGQYAHVWVQDAHIAWHALQFGHGPDSLTSHPTKEAAQEWLIAQFVNRRLDGTR